MCHTEDAQIPGAIVQKLSCHDNLAPIRCAPLQQTSVFMCISNPASFFMIVKCSLLLEELVIKVWGGDLLEDDVRDGRIIWN